MTWRAAFIAQAKHDYAIYNQLNQQRAAISDQLHYLQMASEKLARGYLARPSDTSVPEMTHAGIVRMLQQLKADLPIRRRLGYDSSRAFSRYIDSLLDAALKIQSLAPAIAGTAQPNPEYPWRDRQNNMIRAPFEFDFSAWSGAKNAGMARFLKLLARLIIVLEQ